MNHNTPEVKHEAQEGQQTSEKSNLARHVRTLIFLAGAALVAAGGVTMGMRQVDENVARQKAEEEARLNEEDPERAEAIARERAWVKENEEYERKYNKALEQAMQDRLNSKEPLGAHD
jgi:uncharacterized protein HemX